MSLNDARLKLDKIDKEIIKLLNERMEVSKEVKIIKAKEGLNSYDETREKAIIKKMEDLSKPEFRFMVNGIYGKIMRESESMIGNRVYGLIGRNLSHSKSREIHARFADYQYNLINLKEDELESFFKNRLFKGINVTIPYKEKVIKYLDYIDPLAKEIGAVNTIVNRDGKLYGFNTDYEGFKYLVESEDIDYKNKKVLILGTGGASKTVETYLKNAGAENIVKISRTDENNYTNIEKYCDFNAIINATPVGMYPNNGESLVDLDRFKNLESVVDLIYNPINTKLVLDAKDRNIKSIGGLKMLLSQGYFASNLFLDKDNKDDMDFLELSYYHILAELKNIVLIGMPGAGKSTIGEIIADKTFRKLIDTDLEIEKEIGMTIPEFFEKYGEKEFRKIESEIIKKYSKESGVVIATGGGSILDKKNRDLLDQNGFIVYLDRDLENLEISGRPLSKNLEELKNLKKERERIYKDLADFTIKNIENKKEEIAIETIGKFYEDSSN